jgi:hypothetical protein
MASTDGKSRFDVTINPFVINNHRASQMRGYASKNFRKSYPYFGTVTFPGPIPNPHGFSCEAEAWESPVKRDEYNCPVQKKLPILIYLINSYLPRKLAGRGLIIQL